MTEPGVRSVMTGSPIKRLALPVVSLASGKKNITIAHTTLSEIQNTCTYT